MGVESMDGMSKDLPYDLRQIYAVEILGEHLKDIARARKANNYPLYFECLKDVWIISQHKFKKEKIKVKQGEEETEVTLSQYFNILMDYTAKLSMAYPGEWSGDKGNPKVIAAITQSLNNTEMFLYNKIEEAKMFGSSRDIPGL